MHAFDGLMLAVAVAACLAPLALLERLGGWRRFCGALVVGFAYLVAASFVQGAFKETIQALFVVAFAIGLLQLGMRSRRDDDASSARRAVPLAVLAAGTVYVYSFPGPRSGWLGGARGLGRCVELVRLLREGGRAEAASVPIRGLAPAAGVALAVFVVAIRAGAGPDGRLRLV